MGHVVVIKSVEKVYPSNHSLKFQWCKFNYDGSDDNHDFGYRFIWTHPNGNLNPARGQARIPSINDLLELLIKAWQDGWLIRCESETGMHEIMQKLIGLNFRRNNGHDLAQDIHDRCNESKDIYQRFSTGSSV